MLVSIMSSSSPTGAEEAKMQSKKKRKKNVLIGREPHLFSVLVCALFLRVMQLRIPGLFPSVS